jgi:hypothetical protein
VRPRGADDAARCAIQVVLVGKRFMHPLLTRDIAGFDVAKGVRTVTERPNLHRVPHAKRMRHSAIWSV